MISLVISYCSYTYKFFKDYYLILINKYEPKNRRRKMI